VDGPQNMVIKFLAREARGGPDGLQEWRYCGSRGAKPAVRPHERVEVAFSRQGLESRMRIADWETKGREAGRELTAHHVAVYGHDAQFALDDLVVRGQLDPQFVAQHRLDLAGWKPRADPGRAGPTAAEPVGTPGLTDDELASVRERIQAYPSGTPHAALAAMLRDAALPGALRSEAAARATEVGDKRLVPHLVDGLYSDDLPARKLSHQVVEALAGKSFGYRAEAAEESRKKAIQALNAHLQKHAQVFR
jgi:hypothetical protein